MNKERLQKVLTEMTKGCWVENCEWKVFIHTVEKQLDPLVLDLIDKRKALGVRVEYVRLPLWTRIKIFLRVEPRHRWIDYL